MSGRINEPPYSVAISDFKHSLDMDEDDLVQRSSVNMDSLENFESPDIKDTCKDSAFEDTPTIDDRRGYNKNDSNSSLGGSNGF